MKIALVHDYIKEYGGAERVLEALHEVFPDAPVFTTVYLPDFLGPHKNRFKDWDIRTSILQYLPLKAKLISPFRIIAPLIFRRFDFSKYDAVIVSATGAYIPNAISKIKYQISKTQIKDQKFKKPIFITYCHTPPRYLYGYATARDWKKNIVFRVLGEIANHFLRQVDFKSAQNPDFFIANSKEVAQRIKKFYRRDAVVIYPPVEITTFQVPPRQRRGPSTWKVNLKPNGYFLTGGRLARPKNIHLIVEACVKLGVPLKVFGRGFTGQDIKDQISKIKNTDQKSKIEFVGEVTDEEKLELMRNAKAYIFASEDEDFGITPVEAMSVGTPVITYRSGGVLETVIDPSTGSGQGATGIFFDELSTGSLIKAIQHFNDMNHHSEFNPHDCVRQAQKFSKERFKKAIAKFVEDKWREHKINGF